MFQAIHFLIWHHSNKGLWNLLQFSFFSTHIIITWGILTSELTQALNRFFYLFCVSGFFILYLNKEVFANYDKDLEGRWHLSSTSWVWCKCTPLLQVLARSGSQLPNRAIVNIFCFHVVIRGCYGKTHRVAESFIASDKTMSGSGRITDQKRV